MKSGLAIAIGTGIQEKICRAIYPVLRQSSLLSRPEIVSLERYYRLGLCHDGFEHLRILRDSLPQPWYERSRVIKLLSLAPYLWQLFLMSFKTKHYVFFVDTGILERSAIFFLRALGCKVAILQDALKRRPTSGSQRSLTWFGGGGADLYLLMGERYRPMVWSGRTVEIVGSPIYKNGIEPLPPGKNILIINQCFAKYGEVSLEDEYNFVVQVIEYAVCYGPVELRLHPHNEPKRYMNLSSSRVKVTKRRPLRQSLTDAGIVLTINSTVILEALALGRPVMTLAWHPSPFGQPVNDVVTRCNNQGQMCAALERWKKNQQPLTVEPEKLQKIINSFIACDSDESKNRIVKALEFFVSDA